VPATQLQPSSPPRPRTRSTSPRSNEVDRSPAAAVLARCRWIEPPRLRTAENPRAKRRARSLELFFDLVFVVVVDKLAELLADDPSAVGVLRFLLLFATVCVTWVGYRIYADRFDTGDVLQRVLMLCGMLAVAAVAVNIRGAFTGGSAGFAIAYVAVRVVLMAMYPRRKAPGQRDACAVEGSAYGQSRERFAPADTKATEYVDERQCTRAWLSSNESPRSCPPMIDQNREQRMGSPAGHR
jgi:hypothetical protein